MCTQGQPSPNQLRNVEVLSKPCSCSTARGGTGEKCCLCYEHLPYFVTFRKELVRVHPKLFGAKRLNPAKGRVMLHTQSSEGKTFLASLHPISSPPSKPIFTFLKNRDRSRLSQPRVWVNLFFLLDSSQQTYALHFARLCSPPAPGSAGLEDLSMATSSSRPSWRDEKQKAPLGEKTLPRSCVCWRLFGWTTMETQPYHLITE